MDVINNNQKLKKNIRIHTHSLDRKSKLLPTNLQTQFCTEILNEICSKL